MEPAVAVALQILASGFAAGAVYGLVAVGHSLVFRLTGVVHFAFGELIALGVLPGYRGVWRSMHFSGRIPIETAWRVWPGWTERALTREVPSVESATPAASAQPSERLH